MNCGVSPGILHTLLRCVQASAGCEINPTAASEEHRDAAYIRYEVDSVWVCKVLARSAGGSVWGDDSRTSRRECDQKGINPWPGRRGEGTNWGVRRGVGTGLSHPASERYPRQVRGQSSDSLSGLDWIGLWTPPVWSRH